MPSYLDREYLQSIFNYQQKINMNTSTKGHKNKLPEWQSARMKSLIEERWSEVWEIVVARERLTENLDRHSLDSQRS